MHENRQTFPVQNAFALSCGWLKRLKNVISVIPHSVPWSLKLHGENPKKQASIGADGLQGVGHDVQRVFLVPWRIFSRMSPLVRFLAV